MMFFPSFYLDRVSTYAGDIDNVILAVGILVGFWFFLAEAAFFYFIVKFRQRDGVKAQYIDGSKKEHMRWISYPHYAILVCDLIIVFMAVRVWTDVKIDLPEPEETIRVVAQQWAWSFQHAGLDGKLDTPDDVKTVDVMHVREGVMYNFELVSKDVLHSFSVPVFRLKQDTIPGRVIKGWFKATKTGTYEIQCAEMCGIGHGIMGGLIVIETPELHQQWLIANTPGAKLPARVVPSAAPAGADVVPAPSAPAAAPTAPSAP